MIRLLNINALISSITMCVKKYLVICFLAILSNTDAQSVWSIQQSPTINDFTSIFFINDSTGWITGYNGTILKTTNRGQVWEIQNSGTSKHLSDVFFINDSVGWIVGQAYGGYLNRGIILHTENAGTSWQIQIDDGINNLGSVYFVNDSTGWAVGDNGTIEFTENRGINWAKQESGTDDRLTQVQFISPQKGWISVDYSTQGYYEVKFLKTYNAGITWIPLVDPSQFSVSGGFHFSDSLNGFATGFGNYATSKVILKTTDGGYNWNLLGCNSSIMNGIFSTSENFGWAVGGIQGGQGYVYNTIDGNLWSEQSSPSIPTLNDILFINDSTGWAIGDYGTIIYTDRGNIYTQVPEDNFISKNYNCYPNPSDGFLNLNFESLYNLSKIEIYSCLGVLLFKDEIKESPGQTKKSYDLKYLDNGIYFIRLYESNRQKIIKWIKM